MPLSTRRVLCRELNSLLCFQDASTSRKLPPAGVLRLRSQSLVPPLARSIGKRMIDAVTAK
jgi:hypothetical protein